jgi:anti-sigma B factor antagonist
VATPDEFDVTVETPRDGTIVVHVIGDLDLATSPRVDDALSSADAAHVVIDLAGCTFLDSSGVRVLVEAVRNASGTGRQVSLVAADTGIRRVLEITGVDTMVPVHSSVEEAL